MNEGILFECLSDNLTKAGIVLVPKSPEEIWKIISEAAKEEVDNFITLLQTFITLLKSNNYTFDELVAKNNGEQHEFTRERNKRFIRLVQPAAEAYEAHLTERQEIDFSDMINRATRYIRENLYRAPFKYIVVDEFQDISIGRYQLIKALKDANPDCKLFCVGDDWQSIYRFSGSDITLFKDFERFFGFAVQSKIETTYRFNNPLIQLSSNFILKNPSQAAKTLKSNSALTTEYHLRYSDSPDNDDGPVVSDIFAELAHRVNPDKMIFILGRYGFDINRIKKGEGIEVVIRQINWRF